MTAIQFSRIAFGYTVTFRYDAEVVDLVKATVPSFARSWQPERRAWFVDLDYANSLAAAMRAIGHTVVGLDDPGPPRQPTADASQWAHALFSRVGPDRAASVYRSLSRCLHPDAGGDTQLQQELNSAHDAVTKGQKR